MPRGSVISSPETPGSCESSADEEAVIIAQVNALLDDEDEQDRLSALQEILEEGDLSDIELTEQGEPVSAPPPKALCCSFTQSS